MTAHLPPNLLALFAPRSPLRYIPIPPKKARPLPIYTGIAEFTQFFDDPKTVDYTDYLPLETVSLRRKRIAQEKKVEHDKHLADALDKWDPNSQAVNKTGDPYHTLFVARLSYETTEETLRKEFEYFGPIVKLSIVRDNETGKSRGYAFIEYERERDMKSAYKQADGKRIDGRRVLVDMERGRTIPNWRPRRLGGGLGGRTPARPKPVAPSPGIRRDSYPPRDRTDSYRPPRGGGGGADRRGGGGGGPPRGPPRDPRDNYPGPGSDYHRNNNNRDNYRRDPRDGRDQRDGRDFRDNGRDPRDNYKRDDRGRDERPRDDPRRDYRGHPPPRDRHFERDRFVSKTVHHFLFFDEATS